ncbi:MAG: hypothetical protein U0Z53_23305 [Blastocatellia bacterium]
MPWFPRDQYLWDFWFARQNNELHVFYLQAGHRAAQWNPDLRHDLASVGHAVMTTAGWRELTTDHPAFEKSPGTAWDNRAIWTGCVVQNPADDLHYLFYTARCNEDQPVWTPSEWQRPQQIGLAVSRDLMTWERVAAYPVIPNPGRMIGLDGVAWRDPYVMRGADGCWYAFICARLNPEDKNNKHFDADCGAVIAWLKADDLTGWDCYSTSHLIASDEFYQMEVPQVFWRRCNGGRRFYLIFCAQEKDCSRHRRARQRECATGTYYTFSELLPDDDDEIPPLKEPARLLAKNWYAGRLLDPETETHPLFFGFEWADEAGRFVGGLSDAMPVQFNEDGTMQLQLS